MKLTVLIPVFNEVAFIQKLISRVRQARLPKNITREILVVDDGSTDGSLEALLSLQKEQHNDLLLHRLPENTGKGNAIRAGLALATGDLILIQDADLEYDPAQHHKLIIPLLSGEADVVYGSRFLGSIRGMRLSNRIANLFLSFLASFLFQTKITDEATGLKAFRSDILRSLNLSCKRFEFCPEVTAKLLRQKISIVEVPIDYVARSVEQGKKIRFWDGVVAVFTLVRYRFLR